MRTVKIGGRSIAVYGFWEFRNRFRSRLKWHMDWMKHLLAAYAAATNFLPSTADDIERVLRRFEPIAPYYLRLLLEDRWRLRRLAQEVRAELRRHGLEGFVRRWYTLLVARGEHLG